MIICKVSSDGECKNKCCCIDCDRKETCGLICGYVAEGKIKEPKQCPNAILEGNEMVAFESKAATVIQAIADIASKKKELDDQDKEMRKQLESAMEQFGIRSFENDLIKITYVEPTTRSSVDSTKLKKNYPEIYTECSKVSEVKGSVRITVK